MNLLTFGQVWELLQCSSQFYLYTANTSRWYNSSRNPNNQVSKYMLTGRKEEFTFTRKETSGRTRLVKLQPSAVSSWWMSGKKTPQTFTTHILTLG